MHIYTWMCRAHRCAVLCNIPYAIYHFVMHIRALTFQVNCSHRQKAIEASELLVGHKNAYNQFWVALILICTHNNCNIFDKCSEQCGWYAIQSKVHVMCTELACVFESLSQYSSWVFNWAHQHRERTATTTTAQVKWFLFYVELGHRLWDWSSASINMNIVFQVKVNEKLNGFRWNLHEISIYNNNTRDSSSSILKMGWKAWTCFIMRCTLGCSAANTYALPNG